jgi:hypothetical protein
MGVRITFDAVVDGAFNQTNSIRATISSQQPSWDAKTLKWSYPPWHAVFSTDKRRIGFGVFEIVPTYQLEAGRRYYYLVEVHSRDDSSPAQRTGSFTADVRR